MLKKVLCGLTIALVGVILLLSNLHVIPKDMMIFEFWPVLLILFGIFDMVDERRVHVGNLLVSYIGIYFLLFNFDIITISFWKIVLPLFLITIGISLLWPKKHRAPKHDGKKDVNLHSFFSDVVSRGDGKEFEQADLTAIFGGATLDLRGAIPKGKSCYCNVTTVFGGCDIIMDDTMNVNTDGLTCIFGGVDDHKRQSPKEAKTTLYLVGTVVFGGIDIK